MVLLDKLWDDVVAGPHPDQGLGKLRTVHPPTITIPEGEKEAGKLQRSISMPGGSSTPATPSTPVTPSTPSSARKENVWRSVFNPGSNLNTRTVGAHYFDKPQPSSPTVYDCLVGVTLEWHLCPQTPLEKWTRTLMIGLRSLSKRTRTHRERHVREVAEDMDENPESVGVNSIFVGLL